MSDVATGSPDVCSMPRSCFEPRRDENPPDDPIVMKPNPHAGRHGIRETVSRALETLRTCATSLNRSCHQGNLRSIEAWDLVGGEVSWNRSRCSCVDDDVSISSEPASTAVSSILFDDFFVDAWPRAFRLASFLTHDTQAGEDIAQEVLAEMSQRWGVLERPDAYLQRALMNASSNWNRRGRTATRKLPLLAVQHGDEMRFDELADAIARLPFRQRAVIVLRYYADLTESEIAHALDCRPGTVKSLASRALAALSKEITP